MDASTGQVVNILAHKTSNAIFATIAGKGTCGCSVGEVEDVYNGLFFCFVCDKKYMKMYFEDEKSMFFKSKGPRLMYCKHIL